MWSNILSGFKQVSHEQYYDRLAMCRGCFFFDPVKKRCTDCGCFVKVKAKFKTEDCPQNFWDKLDGSKKAVNKAIKVAEKPKISIVNSDSVSATSKKEFLTKVLKG
jgi:hypothetical protein